MTDTSTAVDVEGDVETSSPAPRLDDGDHDRFAHYAEKGAVSRAYVTGEEILALCGKRFVPTRDPSRYPVCPTCKEIAGARAR